MRGLGKRFQSGQSGNPGGRPKIPADVKELAKALAPDAIRTLGEILRDSEAPPAARISAATAILDRGYGKPVQAINATMNNNLADLTDDELAAIIALARDDLAADVSDSPPHSLN